VTFRRACGYTQRGAVAEMQSGRRPSTMLPRVVGPSSRDWLRCVPGGVSRSGGTNAPIPLSDARRIRCWGRRQMKATVLLGLVCLLALACATPVDVVCPDTDGVCSELVELRTDRTSYRIGDEGRLFSVWSDSPPTATCGWSVELEQWVEGPGLPGRWYHIGSYGVACAAGSASGSTNPNVEMSFRVTSNQFTPNHEFRFARNTFAHDRRTRIEKFSNIFLVVP